MTEELVIGVDLGTGSMKALLMTTRGNVLAECQREYEMISPKPGWNENDPNAWLVAFIEVVSSLAASAKQLGRKVFALGLVSQRDPFVLLDEGGKPAARSISWTDSRSQKEVDQVVKLFGAEKLIEWTGIRPIAGLGLTGLLWIKNQRPDLWKNVARITSAKDYILSAIDGRKITDHTTPTRSLVYNQVKKTWDGNILDSLEISAALFDEVSLDPSEQRSTLGSKWASILGLDEDVVVSAGAGDDQSATLGSNALRPGTVSLGTGTCADFRLVVKGYEPDPEGSIDVAPHVNGYFFRELGIDSTGSALRWFRNKIAPDLSYVEILRLAASTPAGSAGLLFYPFVDGGQRAPFYRDNLQGAWRGLSSHHELKHLARSIVEGIALLYPQALNLLFKSTNLMSDRDAALTIVDGEAKSQFWNQLKADIIQRPLRTTDVKEAGAVGAAILAAKAGGAFSSLEDAANQMVKKSLVFRPDPENSSIYEAVYQDYIEGIEGPLGGNDIRDMKAAIS